MWTRLCLHGTMNPFSKEQEKSIRCPLRHNRKMFFMFFVCSRLLSWHYTSNATRKWTKLQMMLEFLPQWEREAKKVSHQFQCEVRCVKVSSLLHNSPHCSWSVSWLGIPGEFALCIMGNKQHRVSSSIFLSLFQSHSHAIWLFCTFREHHFSTVLV